MKRILIIAVFVLALGAFWAYSRSRPLPVDIATVTRGQIRSFVEEEARTRVRYRYVVAAPVAGRLLRIEWEEGDDLKKGMVAARIDPLHLQAAVAEAEAQHRALHYRITGVEKKKPKPEELERAALEVKRTGEARAVAAQELAEATAAMNKAEKDFKRAREEVEARTGSPADFDAAEAAELQAAARAEAAKIGVRIAAMEEEAARLTDRIVQARVEDYDWEEAAYREDIKALDAKLVSLKDDVFRADILVPIDGQVLEVFEESARFVTAGTPLLELGDPSRLEVEADFLSEDVAHMRKGMEVEVFGRALGDRIVKATISRIHPSAFTKISSLGVEQQRVTVFCDATLGLGDRFRVEVRVILDAEDDAVLVPEGALFRHEGAWHVFKVVDERARLQKVETGLRDGRVRAVKTGLAKGDEVILHPDATIEDGRRVAPLGD